MQDHVKFKLLAGGAVSLIAIATIVYRLLEEWSWVDSLYFSVVAVTTVGFGDFTPTSDAAKLFTVLYVLCGVTIIGSWLHARASRTERLVRRHREQQS
ncbi:MAG: potassium channel family protein [Acidimicrobiia bacterium]